MNKFWNLVLAGLLATSVSMAKNIVYVKAYSTGDGSSWENAMGDVQTAINLYDSAEVWIAKGMYKATMYPPNISSTDSTDEKNFAYYLRNNVEIYGGFTGTETDRNQRDIETNKVTLYGDYHAFVNIAFSDTPIDSSAVLDGVTLYNAQGTVGATYYHGGGMVLSYASPTINNCTFQSCSAGGALNIGYGGAMYCSHSNPKITNCSFKSNKAYEGGAVVIYSPSTPVFEGCVFDGNSLYNSSALGGAIYVDNSYNNRTSGQIAIKNCIFKNNTGGDGGAIASITSYAELLVYNTVFSKNKANSRGGAMYLLNTTNKSYIVNCSVSENTANSGAGGLHCDAASPIVINSILWNNWYKSTDGMNVSISNYSGTASIFSSCANTLTVSTTNGNITDNPKFADENLVLDLSSPCIDAGQNSAVEYYANEDSAVAVDVNGLPRIASGTVDMGAHERQPLTPDANGIVYVDDDGEAQNDGSSWEKAFPNLSSAIMAIDSGRIWVAKGIYRPTENINGDVSDSQWDPIDTLGYHFQLKNNVAVYGSFNGDEAPDYDLSQRTIGSSVIDGIVCDNDTVSYLFYHGNLKYNMDETAILDGFTLQNAKTGMSNSDRANSGYMTSPTIRNCIFTKFETALLNSGSKSLVENCTFTDNAYETIYKESYAAVMNGVTTSVKTGASYVNCTFKNNSPAGMNIHIAPVTVDGCVFEENNGFGLSCSGEYYSAGDTVVCYPVIKNTKFLKNENCGLFNYKKVNEKIINCVFAENRGGGVVNNPWEPHITKVVNCTFYSNTATTESTRGLGFYAYTGNHEITNCIFLNNKNDEGQYEDIYTTDSSLVTYSCITKGNSDYFTGTGVIFEDPDFASTSSYRAEYMTINETSPCVDAGNNDAYTAICSDSSDAFGNARFYGDAIDIGAYEWGVVSINELASDNVVTEFQLNTAYPNPFNPTTTISYSLPKTANVKLTVYNMLGQKVTELVNSKQGAGSYHVSWNASTMPSGIYFYQLHAGVFSKIQKCTLLK